jgi:hypothetical protein
MQYQQLQKQIDSFIGDFGTETLIQYLQSFKKNNPEQDYDFFDSLLRIVNEVYSTNKSQICDMSNKKPTVVDARRQLVYFITEVKKLPNDFVTTWFSCQLRTVYKYRKESSDRLCEKHIYKQFNSENEIINSKIKKYV